MTAQESSFVQALREVLAPLARHFKWVGGVLLKSLPEGWSADLGREDYDKTLLLVLTAPTGRKFPIVLEGEYIAGFYVASDWNRVPEKREKLAALVTYLVEATSEDAT